MEDLKKPATTRIFRAWIEDWEEKAIVMCDCVCEAQLLEKYKGLVFYDPDFGKTYTVDGTNGEYSHGNKKKGIDKGWSLICQDEDGDLQGWNITDVLIGLICEHPQAPGIEIVHREQV